MFLSHLGSWSRRAAFLGMLIAGCIAGSAFAKAQVNVTTYHNDIARTGQNTSETTLAPAKVDAVPANIGVADVDS